MSLRFFYGSGSQFAWRVWLALEHKGVPYECRVLSFSDGEHRQPEYLAINPRHKVPAIDDNGFTLYESAAIVEYLDERFTDGPSLFPGDLEQRALQRRVIAEVDSYLQPLHGRVAKSVFFTPPEKRDPSELEEVKTLWAAEVARYETLVAEGFVGPSIGAADFTLYPFIATAERFDQRHPGLDLQGAIPAGVLAWRDRMRALPYHDKTWPPHWKA